MSSRSCRKTFSGSSAFSTSVLRLARSKVSTRSNRFINILFQFVEYDPWRAYATASLSHLPIRLGDLRLYKNELVWHPLRMPDRLIRMIIRNYFSLVVVSTVEPAPLALALFGPTCFSSWLDRAGTRFIKSPIRVPLTS